MPAAAPRPETQEEILAAALAARDDRDIPAEDDSWVIVDSDGDRPAELAGLDGAELDELIAAAPAPGAETARPGVPGMGRVAGQGSPRAACWTCWRRGWRWPGALRTRTPGWPG